MRAAIAEQRSTHQAAMIERAAQLLESARARGSQVGVHSCCRCFGDFEHRRAGRVWYCPRCRAEVHYMRMDAIAQVNHAVRLGVLMRADQFRCVDDCGGWAQVWDHRDYSKPLQVEPVCQSCNMRRGPAGLPRESD